MIKKKHKTTELKWNRFHCRIWEDRREHGIWTSACKCEIITSIFFLERGIQFLLHFASDYSWHIAVQVHFIKNLSDACTFPDIMTALLTFDLIHVRKLITEPYKNVFGEDQPWLHLKTGNRGWPEKGTRYEKVTSYRKERGKWSGEILCIKILVETTVCKW